VHGKSKNIYKRTYSTLALIKTRYDRVIYKIIHFLILLYLRAIYARAASNYLSNDVVSIESRNRQQAETFDVLDRCQLFIDRQSFTFNASIWVHIPHYESTRIYVYTRNRIYRRYKFIVKNPCLNNDFLLTACL